MFTPRGTPLGSLFMFFISLSCQLPVYVLGPLVFWKRTALWLPTAPHQASLFCTEKKPCRLLFCSGCRDANKSDLEYKISELKERALSHLCLYLRLQASSACGGHSIMTQWPHASKGRNIKLRSLTFTLGPLSQRFHCIKNGK